ncbi:hypothetical protein BGZ61DRAFT_420299 [Ilyonectria robusta]|uniref:uncharacterized protein n=1 Tax=Ilyonectria robusta TaxID=1079257 RepID=UPI001E8E8C07|nr:uncharacterized protein BGZ61DRAFT_420299 [Ilyonectria robusta]KAH8694408.1 hypothetical protein BGZ61DRAFT_420299 [Ilyonectria robusta]
MDSNVNDSLSLARNWLADVQQCLLAKVGRMTIVQLQALILIVRYRLESGDTAEAWALLPLAARLAFTLRLNYELTSMQPIGQESRRRMVWAIWLIDRQFSGGIQDLAVFPTERVHIRLPCDDHSFERGIPSRAQYLNGLGLQTEGYNMDILSYYLQLHVSRDRILKYTKQVIRSGQNPAASKSKLEMLQSELTRFEEGLPPDLKLSPECLRLKTHSRDASSYIALHTLWYQCHCDLYRFLVPGMREFVAKQVFDCTPPEYIMHCQRAYLSSASSVPSCVENASPRILRSL